MMIGVIPARIIVLTPRMTFTIPILLVTAVTIDLERGGAGIIAQVVVQLDSEAMGTLPTATMTMIRTIIITASDLNMNTATARRIRGIDTTITTAMGSMADVTSPANKMTIVLTARRI